MYCRLLDRVLWVKGWPHRWLFLNSFIDSRIKQKVCRRSSDKFLYLLRHWNTWSWWRFNKFALFHWWWLPMPIKGNWLANLLTISFPEHFFQDWAINFGFDYLCCFLHWCWHISCALTWWSFARCNYVAWLWWLKKITRFFSPMARQMLIIYSRIH